MPSISNYLDATQILVDAIVDTADQQHRQQSCHMSATALAIDAFIKIDRQHCQPGCCASAPAINAIVDINCRHHCQQSRRALSSAPALAIDAIIDSVKKLPRICSHSPLQLPPTDNSDLISNQREPSKSTSSDVVLVLDSSCISSIPTWITIMLQVLHLWKKQDLRERRVGILLSLP